MDDCNLNSLTVKPGALSPAFSKNVTDYHTTVPSNVEQITFNPQTSDNGASFSISNSGGTRDVPLKEGATTDVKIEVSSEDGHTKNYFVHVKRLSARDAVLTALTVQNGSLEPEFNPNQEIYFCLLPSNTSAATVAAVAPDPKNVVVINGGPPDTPVLLNPGLTIANIEITSADGSNKKTYKLEIVRKQIPRYVKLTDQKASVEYECPISLSPLYCPITVKGSNPRCSYTGPVIMELTRTSKVDPHTGQNLPPGWEIQDISLDQKLAAQMAVIPLTYAGATPPGKFGQLAENLAECSKPAKPEIVSVAFGTNALPLNRQLQEHKWQKALQQVFDESNPSNLMTSSDTYLEEYYSRIPKPGQYNKQYDNGESPMDSLQNAIYCLATAIKLSPRNEKMHYKLAMVLEEKYLAEDMYGLKKEEKEEAQSLNLQAKESSKEEEVFAICKLKGVDASAPISHHLQALDAEYHHLIDTRQSGKADHVQSLYVWYSKKVSREGAAAHKAEDNESPLGQAYQKYLDTLSLEESNDIYNFHVGRILVIMGNYDDAIKRLEVSLSLNMKNEIARFYLGLAISLSTEEWKKRGKEAIRYLLDGMEKLLSELSTQANMPEQSLSKCSLFAESLVRASNVHFLRGIIQLGNLLTNNSDVKDAMSPVDVYHTAALLASQVLPRISRGDLYKQVEWVLVDAHTQLLELLTQKPAGNEDLITSRCQRLSALIFSSTISGNTKLLELQERTCQKLVKIQPCLSYALFLLGSAQFALCENSPEGKVDSGKLSDARASFQASIELEGKSSLGKAPDHITTGRGGVAPKGTPAPAAGVKGGKAAAPAPVQEPAPQPNPKTEPVPAPATESAFKKVEQKNVKSYQARLGLARVLRASNEPNEAKIYYAQVMDMAPEVHDAYIESAEMLSKTDPLEAVNVYSRFPVSATPSYDDAYIFGEIVRLLMKAEMYDDQRLLKNMVILGKIMGTVVLDNYTKILEQKHKNELLRKVYAGINNKSVDDPDMQAFFKFKFWI